MNWLEFKDLIDEELERQGISHDTEVNWIDLGTVHEDFLEVGQHRDGSIIISEL